MLKTYTGGCHCGAVRFEAEIDLDQGTGKCNCTYCGKVRWWGAILKPAAFRLLSGADALSDYHKEGHPVHHPFCKHCGIHSFGRGHLEVLGGDYVSVNMACLDTLSPADLVAAPVRFMDGRNNNWFEQPTEIRHL